MSNLNKWTAVAVVAAVLCFSCHPAKQVQKEDEDIQALRAKWIADWVKDHPCPQIPPMNLDSLCGANDFAFDLGQKDTVVSHDTIAAGCRPVVRRILVPYEDTRTENLLYDSLRAKTEALAMLEGRQEAGDQGSAEQAAAMKRSRNTWLWAFIGACIVIVAGIAWKVYTLFTNPLKILK